MLWGKDGERRCSYWVLGAGTEVGCPQGPSSLESPILLCQGDSSLSSPMDSQMWTHTPSFKHRHTHMCTQGHSQTHFRSQASGQGGPGEAV